MKITMCFEATSMANLKDQLLEAFGSISVGGGEIAKDTRPALQDELTSKSLEKIAAPSIYDIPQVPFTTPQDQTTGVAVGPMVTSGMDVAAPNSDKTVLDGYTVSNGQVWVPVEGRSSAFTGIPMERYQAQKAAKETGAELDSKGTPYDANIHTATKLKTQSGEWKKKPVRGVKTEAAQPQWQPPVANQAAPVQIPVTNEPTVTIPFTQFPPVEQAQQTPVIESLAPAIGNAPPMHSYESFKKNLGKITFILTQQGKIDRNYLLQLAKYFEVNDVWDLVDLKHDEKCRILYQSFIENGLILGA